MDAISFCLSLRMTIMMVMMVMTVPVNRFLVRKNH
uniref:Uncharacterized protein n=1 Tax=Anguilla anguilla TaxID=7936 RepID=A0A0E9UU37_ANGAN